MYHKLLYLFYRWQCKFLYHRFYMPFGRPAFVKAEIIRAMRYRSKHRDYRY